MADADDKTLDVVGLPEDPAPHGKNSNPNVEAVSDEVGIARIEEVYK
jgi:hypothetical protein